MENPFSFSLSCRPTHLFLFLFHPAAQKLFPAGPFPASWPTPAQRPSPLPVSPPGGPRPSGSSPSPDRAGLKLESDSAARAAASPLGPHAQAPDRPYKRNPRLPLDLAKPAAAALALANPSSQSRRLRRAPNSTKAAALGARRRSALFPR